MDGLRIDRLPDGGFVVTSNPELGAMSVCRFASSSIEAALGYIKGKLDPAATQAMPTHGFQETYDVLQGGIAGCDAKPMTAEQVFAPADGYCSSCGASPVVSCPRIGKCLR